MIIGHFTYDADTETYTGAIRTTAGHLRNVRISPREDWSSSVKYDYTIGMDTALGLVECGEARRTTSANGTPYLAVVIDDPALAKPIKASLLPTMHGAHMPLVWDRPKRRWIGF